MGIKIIGTGHILSRSVDEVKANISEYAPDLVAVELDLKRFRALEGVNFDPEGYGKRISFKEVIGSLVGGRSFPVLFEGILALIQQELGDRYGIYPGSDMCAAIISAKNCGSRIAIIDRDIDITMNRLMRTPLKEIIHLFFSRNTNLKIIPGLFGSNIEEILGEEKLGVVLNWLKKEFPSVHTSLVDERDRYMAYMLNKIQLENPEYRILAVVGAGHKKGILRYLDCIRQGQGVNLKGIRDVKPISFIRIILLVFMVFVALILIKLGFMLEKRK